MNNTIKNIKTTEQLQEIMQKYFIFLKTEKQLSQNSIDSYFSDLKDLFTFLSENQNQNNSNSNNQIDKNHLEQIDIKTFRKWLSKRLDNNICLNSNARAISSVRNFFKFLEENEIIKNNEIFKINKPKLPKLLPKALSVSEFEKFFQFIEETSKIKWQILRDKTIVMLMFTAGLRISEVVQIKKMEIFNKNGIVNIKGKGNKIRTIPITNSVRQLATEYINACPFDVSEKSEFFLTNTGQKINSRSIQRMFEKVRILSNLPDYVTPHTIRHSCATILLENGNEDSLLKIQKLLGHSKLSTTQIYTKITNSTIEKELNNANYWKS